MEGGAGQYSQEAAMNLPARFLSSCLAVLLGFLTVSTVRADDESQAKLDQALILNARNKEKVIELLQKGPSLQKQEPWASMENVGHW